MFIDTFPKISTELRRSEMCLEQSDVSVHTDLEYSLLAMTINISLLRNSTATLAAGFYKHLTPTEPSSGQPSGDQLIQSYAQSST